MDFEFRPASRRQTEAESLIEKRVVCSRVPPLPATEMEESARKERAEEETPGSLPRCVWHLHHANLHH